MKPENKQQTPEQIETLLHRGVHEIIGKEEVQERLLNGDVLRVKLGVDPTSPHLHLGRSIPLLKLRDFQEQGHVVVFIIGDFTGVIGDTSDKDSERPMLTTELVEENMKNYFDQVGKLIDLEKVEMHHNSEWLNKLGYKEIGEHANQFSVADFIARENIKKRLDAGKRVSLREVLYPLMQGYDSVAVKADIEVGGTDQRFNMLAGRKLQESTGATPQSILMNPLIEGLDGRKMSSSWGNTINLTDSAEDMYGKVMSLHDDLIGRYFELCTRVPLIEVQEKVAKLQEGTLHPRDVKMQLAREIVTLYHNTLLAEQAEKSFVSTFQNKELPENIQEASATKGSPLSEVLVSEHIVASNSEFRRLTEAGAIHILEGEEKETITDPSSTIERNITLKVGKRRFVRIIIK